MRQKWLVWKFFLISNSKSKTWVCCITFLGVEAIKEGDNLILTQRKFTIDLLVEFRCDTLSTVSSPLVFGLKLTPQMGQSLSDPKVYKRLIGKLNYLTHTRPDLSLFVQLLSQLMGNPHTTHMEAALHVVRYLKNNPSQGIFMISSANYQIQAFCDSEWASCSQTRHWVSGFYITLGGSRIS